MGKIQRLYALLTALVRARHLEAPEKMRPFEFSPLRIFPALVIIIIIIIIIIMFIIRLGIFFVQRVQSTQNVGFNHLDSAHAVCLSIHRVLSVRQLVKIHQVSELEI